MLWNPRSIRRRSCCEARSTARRAQGSVPPGASFCFRHRRRRSSLPPRSGPSLCAMKPDASRRRMSRSERMAARSAPRRGHPSSAALCDSRPSRGWSGSRAIDRPTGVTEPSGARAPKSMRRRRPDSHAAFGGGSSQQSSVGSFTPHTASSRIRGERSAKSISGGVKGIIP